MLSSVAMLILISAMPVSVPELLNPASASWSPLPGTRALYQGVRQGVGERRVAWIGMREGGRRAAARTATWAFTIRRTEFDCEEKTLRLIDGVAFSRANEPIERLRMGLRFRPPPGTEAEAQLEAICSLL